MATAQAEPRGRRPLEQHNVSGTGGNGTGGERLTTALGWFSLGLGIAEFTAPERVARLIGVDDTSSSRTVLRALGLREIVSGIGILSRSRPRGWVRARVGGDMMDLAVLGTAYRSGAAQPRRVAAAAAALAGVTALDILASQQLAGTPSNGATSNGAARAGTTRSRTARSDMPVRVARSITINRPVAEVYDFWHDFTNLPRFMYHLESVEITGSGRSHWTARAPAGTTVEWDAEVTEDRHNELIAWRSLPGADVDNSGAVRFGPAPGGRGTEVHVELRYDPPAGRVGAFVAKLFGEEPDQQVRDDLRRFKQVIETGEIVRSAASPEGTGERFLSQREAQPATQEQRQ